MGPCKHESLEFVGEQKTDDGVNSYYRCKSCQVLLVMMPSKKVVGIPGVQRDKGKHGDPNTS
jgi:hypothetical protein